MLRFYYVDFKLVIVKSGQCTFQSLFPNFSVCFGWYFLVRWVGYFDGIFKIWVLFWWLHFDGLRLEFAYHQ